jgi:hypothetical protein
MASKNLDGNPKKIDVQKYLLVLCLTVIIFGSGLLVGNWVASEKFNTLEGMGQDLRTDIMALELQQELIKAEPCKEVALSPLSQQLYSLGTRLDFMESTLGIDNPEVIQLKQYYSLLEMRHWLYMKEMNKNCNRSNVLILYFYSNKNDCAKCEDQGYVLSYLHDKYPNVMIYSFDKNMNNVALTTLIKNFNIQEAPTVVINDQTHAGYQTRDFIESIINQNQPTQKENNMNITQ